MKLALITRAASACALVAVLFGACTQGMAPPSLPSVPLPPATPAASSAPAPSTVPMPSVRPAAPTPSPEDTQTDWDAAQAAVISLNGASAASEDPRVFIQGSTVTITHAGTFVLSGTLDDGCIAVAATGSDTVRLILNGASITNATGAAIYASQCQKLIVTLADGTQNMLADGGDAFAYADAGNEEPNAALFCKDDLTLNGGGALTVTAGFRNGIGSKDHLLILGGSYDITAQNHGLRANDSLTIAGGSLTIAADNDGIQTNETDGTGDAGLAAIFLQGGDFIIDAAHDAVQSGSSIIVTGGDYRLTSGGGASSNRNAASESFKGLKAAGNLFVEGGTLAIDSYDDALHADGGIAISGGTLTLASTDDAVHADADLTITGGILRVTQSYEGLEAAHIAISGGDIVLYASDDGVNAAGGRDQASDRGFERDRFTPGRYGIVIDGGWLTLYAGGDGIDANGTLTIGGGTVVSLIDSTPDNGALDADGAIVFTGGAVIYGGSGLGGFPQSGSTQSFVRVDATSPITGEVVVSQDGQALLSFAPPFPCAYLCFSSPDIQSGQSYGVAIDGTASSNVVAGEGATGGWPPRR